MRQSDFEAYWRGLDAESLRQQFDMRVAVPDGPAFTARHLEMGGRARARLTGALGVRYGAGPAMTLDIFQPSCRDAPVVMFWHGGGWQNNSKSHFSFVAEPLVAAGILAVIVGYDLFPTVPMTRMMEEAREAVAWAARNIRNHGGDPHRLIVCGHSAGAQLCGMALAHDYSREGLRPSPVAGALLISGSYDMQPHRCHERYLALLPDDETAHAASMALNLPRCASLPMCLAVGERETPGYIAQTHTFASQLTMRGHPVQVLVSPDDHHFSIMERLADPNHALVRALVDLARESRVREP